MFRFIKQIIISACCSIFLFSCAVFYTPVEKQENDSIQSLRPEDRFVVYKTGVVFDKKTALEWYADDITKLEKQGTRYWLSRLNKKDPGWRLPTRAELYDLNKNGRVYCKTLRLPRDTFWIKNYRVYDIILNLDITPRFFGFRHGFYSGGREDGNGEIRAHIIVVRYRPDKLSKMKSSQGI